MVAARCVFDCSMIGPGTCCRDEHCGIDGIHAPHKVRQRKRPPKAWLQRDTLDDSIERAVLRWPVASFQDVLDEVINDYGSLGPTQDSGVRRLHRRLHEVCKAGRVKRVEVSKRIFAYVAPGSRLRDPSELRELVLEKISYERGLCGD